VIFVGLSKPAQTAKIASPGTSVTAVPTVAHFGGSALPTALPPAVIVVVNQPVSYQTLGTAMAEPHGIDHFDATFARDLAWAQTLREQLAEMPTIEEPEQVD
jgi:hypothetical protein